MSKNRRGKATDSDRLVIRADVIAKYLSEFTYSEDFQGMQFVRLNLPSKKIESLDKSLLDVKHLRYIDFSGNKISDVSMLQPFEFLVHLNLNNNAIKNLNAFTVEESFPRLKKLELMENKITELVPLTAPKLEFLDISNNNIDKVEAWTGHPNIKIFKATLNKFKNLSVIKDMPLLEEAYLADNPINAFNGYDNVPALKILHLRKTKVNKIEEELPEMPAIEYINLRQSSVNSLEHLKNLFQFSTIKDLNILDSPLEQNATSMNMLLAEVLNLHKSLQRFCKVTVTEQNRYEALYLSEYRWKKAQEEERRKKEEEEARLKAEAEGDE